MRLPSLSSDIVIKILKSNGYQVTRQKGSHICLHKKTEQGYRLVVVPETHDLPKGTLRDIIRKAGLTREEFINIYNTL